LTTRGLHDLYCNNIKGAKVPATAIVSEVHSLRVVSKANGQAAPSLEFHFMPPLKPKGSLRTAMAGSGTPARSTQAGGGSTQASSFSLVAVRSGACVTSVGQLNVVTVWIRCCGRHPFELQLGKGFLARERAFCSLQGALPVANPMQVVGLYASMNPPPLHSWTYPSTRLFFLWYF
jgi:hypothetical protein